jgi:hypothetical protein
MVDISKCGVPFIQFVWKALLGFSGVVGCSLSVLAHGYNPLPKAWNIKVGLAGTLDVGAEYCTESGRCQQVGNDIVGLSIGGSPVGGIQGCLSMPRAPACLNARIPVEVLVATDLGNAIVRLKGKNYSATPSTNVSVIYRGVNISLNTWLVCFSPGRHEFIGSNPCEMSPH